MIYILINIYNVSNTFMHIYQIFMWQKYLHFSDRETEVQGHEMTCFKAHKAEKPEPSTKAQCFPFTFFPLPVRSKLISVYSVCEINGTMVSFPAVYLDFQYNSVWNRERSDVSCVQSQCSLPSEKHQHLFSSAIQKPGSHLQQCPLPHHPMSNSS